MPAADSAVAEIEAGPDLVGRGRNPNAACEIGTLPRAFWHTSSSPRRDKRGQTPFFRLAERIRETPASPQAIVPKPGFAGREAGRTNATLDAEGGGKRGNHGFTRAN
jgi:hypothetical protein